MKRKNLFNALLIAGLLAGSPLVADAAGLGKLKVNSALGQPLRAEVDLISVPKDEVDLITARVASAEAYKQAKVERQEGLSALRFTVEKRANGDPYLKISSTQAFNEPFVDLLIQLDWPSGRLLREYTILLDPPGFQEAPAISAPKVVAEAPVKPSVATRTESPKPAFATPAKKGKKSARAATKAAPAESTTPAEQTFPRENGDPATQTAASPTTSAASAPMLGEEYKVKKGDTLSKIARELKPEGYSLDQVMVALYENNKRAFDGNNMNRMKTGQILHMPDQSMLEAKSSGAAAKEIKAHAADWNAYRQKLAGTVTEQPAAKAEAPSESSGKITAKAEDKAAKPAEPNKDVLKLSRGEAPGKGSATSGKGSADAKALQDKLVAAQDDALAKEKALKEANSRISDLDKNIKEMQALLELKNKQLADLEKQAKTKAPAPTPVPTPVPAPAAKVEPPKPAPKPEAAKPEAAKPAITPPPPPSTPTAEKPPEPLVKAVPEQSTPPTAQVPPAPKPVPAEKKPALKPVVKPATPPEPEMSLLDTVMSNPTYLAGVAAVIIGALFAGLWAIGRRRKKSLASFEDSIMTGGGDIKTNTVFGNTAGGQIDTGDTSFLTDFSQAGMGAIDTNDVDPIAEAEVYMAYGRDAQAEEILKEAMSKDPARHEIQLKLLEIYAGRKNAAAFETLAAELYAATSGRGPVWEKAAELGRGLDPANPLYAAPDGRAEDPVAAHSAMLAGLAAAPLAQDMDLHLDLDKSEASSASHTSLDETTVRLDEDKGSLDQALDLDIDTVMGNAPNTTMAANDANTNLDTLDFNLDTIIPQAVEKHADAPANSSDMDMHALDLNIPEAGAPHAESPAQTAAHDEAMALDFDFNLEPEPSPSSTPASPPAAAEAEEPLMPELDLSGIDLNLDRASAASASGGTPLEEATTLVGDNTVWEEASTKLDLARAYLEMGDQEGAREILQEVVGEGGPEQQTEAKKLLATLS